MMATNTITSLAILKVSIDQGKDYLDYLRPFILQVLVDHDPRVPVTDDALNRAIRKQFGLEIPRRIIQIVLNRMASHRLIKRERSIYWKSGDIPDPQIAAKKASVERHISSVLHGLREFSQETIQPIVSDERAVTVICAFLAKFDITCLRAYLRGTAIPDLGGVHQTEVVLVSDYVQHLRRTNPERFESFLIVVQGHMLANALICPDLPSCASEYSGVTFFLDTPLLIHLLGCEGDAKQDAVQELIEMVRKFKGSMSAFSHSQVELERVLKGAAVHLESRIGRGGIIMEARKRGTTRSDLLLLASQVDERLEEAGVSIVDTPRYIEKYQIDESIFEQVLESEVKYYYNPRAKEYDINSVRSIYVIRGEMSAPSLEQVRAVFVTSNAQFARAAWNYGQKYESSRDVSSVITDFSLANIAWLKAPMEAPNLPTAQLLAFSYAALQPSSELWGKLLQEIDKLEAEGTINERALQVLRSDSPLVHSELMHLTLGEDNALTGATPREIFDRVSAEIRKEESEKLAREQQAHEETQEALDTERTRNEEMIGNICSHSRSKARKLANVVSGIVIVFLIVGLLWEAVERPNSSLDWIFVGGILVLLLLTVGNLVFDVNVLNIHAWVQKWFMKHFLREEARKTGIDLEELKKHGGL